MALARMEGYFDSRSMFLISSMAIYAVLLEISEPVPRGITNFANRETARLLLSAEKSRRGRRKLLALAHIGRYFNKSFLQ